MSFILKDGRYRLYPLILAAAAYLLTVALVGMGAFMSEDYDIEVGAIAMRTYRAPRDIVNEVATNMLREAASAQVDPVFYNDGDITAAVLADIEAFFGVIGQLRAAYMPIFSPFAPIDVLDGGFVGAVPQMPADLAVTLTDAEYLLLVTGDSATFSRFFEYSRGIIGDVLETGLQAEHLIWAAQMIESDLERVGFDNNYVSIGGAIASAIVRPNFVIDEDTTRQRREEAAAQVLPVMIQGGQNIVVAGDPITEAAYVVLVGLGYGDTDGLAAIVLVLGSLLAVSLVFLISMFYIIQFKPEIIRQRKLATLLFSLFLMTMILTRLMADLPFYFTPVLLFAMLVSVLIDMRLAMILAVGAAVLSLIIYGGDVMLITYISLVGVFSALVAKYVVVWAQVLKAISALLAVCVAMVLANYLLFARALGPETFNSAAFAVAGGGLSIMLCIGSLPLWAHVFEVTTPQALLQLTNPNNELMRRMTIEAPGTYHHSLIVANLSETAAYDIGADHVLARVGSYYHDIGKMKYSHYFSENQTGVNPHDTMAPRDSVEVITDHITRGLELAKQHKLPSCVRDFIEQHHGDGLMKVFFYKETTANPDNPVNESDFRYKNPIPQNREVAIVMMADTAEAAVRSNVSKGKSMDEIEVLVRQLIKAKMDDGQLNDSGLAIKDLEIIARSFMKVFRGMYHERVPYPTLKELSDAVEAAGGDGGVFDDEREGESDE